jgi:hypothetical protein
VINSLQQFLQSANLNVKVHTFSIARVKAKRTVLLVVCFLFQHISKKKEKKPQPALYLNEDDDMRLKS